MNITITIQATVYRTAFCFKHDVLKTGFCFHLQLEPIQSDPTGSGDRIQSQKCSDLNTKQGDG
jgi:hypothetical protein